jgi:hypothetical protein
MKTYYKTILIILFTFMASLLCNAGNHQINTGKTTTGNLFVSFATGNSNGKYSPRNVVAVWIEDNTGIFVKTLLVNAQKRMKYLTNWLNNSPAGDKTDAITGATSTTFGNLNCSWNGKDTLGTLVSDGTYKLCMEMSDKNSSGNFSCFTFKKVKSDELQTPANKPGFSNILIHWTPKKY